MTPAQLYLNLSCNNIDALGESENKFEDTIDQLILPEIKQQLLKKYQIYCQGAKKHPPEKDNIELNDKDILIKSQLYVVD